MEKFFRPSFCNGKNSSEQGGYASARRPQTGQNFCPGGANPAASRKISAERSGQNLYSSKAPASELVVPRRQTHTAEHDAVALTQWPMPSDNGKSKSMTVLSPCEHRARTKAHTHTHTFGSGVSGPCWQARYPASWMCAWMRRGLWCVHARGPFML